MTNREDDPIDMLFESLTETQREPWNHFEQEIPKPNPVTEIMDHGYYQLLKQIYCFAVDSEEPTNLDGKNIFQIINERVSQHADGNLFTFKPNWKPESFNDVIDELGFHNPEGKHSTILKILTSMQTSDRFHRFVGRIF